MILAASPVTAINLQNLTHTIPMPPGLPVYLDDLLPDPRTAPLGRCSRCRFTAALTADGLCGACITQRAQGVDR
jgi:hypothetical protein